MPDEIREITEPEWEALRPIFEQEGGHLPDRQHATAIVCIDEKGLAGFWTVQEIYWAGPLWIRPDRRRTGLWRKLHDVLHAMFLPGSGTGYYSFSDSDKMNHVFAELGYTAPDVRVWMKEV